MESVRVDICYRPLRIGWAIRAGDKDAFRAATRLSFALWGGRFNPIIIVDHRDEAESLIDVFRVDVILPIGDSEDVKGFVKRLPYLTNPSIVRACSSVTERVGPGHRSSTFTI